MNATETAARLSNRSRKHLARIAMYGEVRIPLTVCNVLERAGLVTCRGWDDGALCSLTELGREVAKAL